MPIVTKEELRFLEKAKEHFIKFPEYATYRNNDETLIALRYTGQDLRDSIRIFQIKEVAKFESVLDPAPALVLEQKKGEFS